VEPIGDVGAERLEVVEGDLPLLPGVLCDLAAGVEGVVPGVDGVGGGFSPERCRELCRNEEGADDLEVGEVASFDATVGGVRSRRGKGVFDAFAGAEVDKGLGEELAAEIQVDVEDFGGKLGGDKRVVFDDERCCLGLLLKEVDGETAAVVVVEEKEVASSGVRGMAGGSKEISVEEDSRCGGAGGRRSRGDSLELSKDARVARE